ncbi:hypothetical protein [Rothia nasimurium]|uniref:hypothetical protein n=1 Tax=Rothia nasimurium TaxID=85336 RepID=UPI001F223E65|nr:hypothetical protein [Rothia nasimurium]
MNLGSFISIKVKKFSLTSKFFLSNIFSKSTVIGEKTNPVVSLTTYGPRAKSVFITLESIASGKARPSRLILWVDEDEFYDNPPRSIKRLIKRGLEVRKCVNYGPHKKYYPYSLSQEQHKVSMVTADDDIMYPDYWLQKLIVQETKSPNQIIGYRTRYIPTDSAGEVLPYNSWKLNDSTEASFNVFPTGTSGVLYPGPFLEILKNSGDGSITEYSKVDDIWLHKIALENNFRPRQAFPLAENYPTIFMSQRVALFRTNVVNNNNDKLINGEYGDLLNKMIGSN